MTDVQTAVEALLKKAVETQNADAAMRYTQAALNAAHVKHALEQRP